MLDPDRTSTPVRLSLKRRVLGAGGWVIIGFSLSLAIRFATSLLMTRLLVPEMFGIMSLASTILVGLTMFSDLGLKQCIIQSERGHDPVFLNTAWAVQVLQGALLWLAALVVGVLLRGAGQFGLLPAGSTYADPILPYVIAALSSTALVAGLGSTKFHEASRKLALGRIARIIIISQLTGLLCMLAWVSIDRSIWVLVAGGLATAVAQTCLSQIWLPGPVNRWQWDRAALRDILGFGKWMFLSSILGFLVNNGDRLLLGGMVDTAVLGVYAIASVLFGVVDQVLGTIVTEISFPALSEVVRERPQEASAGYYRFHVVLAGLAYFSGGFLMISAPTLVNALYDARYAEAGWMLQILAVALLTIPARLATQYFLAVGLPHLMSLIIGIRLVTLFVSFPIGFLLFGVPGALGGVVLSQFSYVPAIVFYSVKHKLFNVAKELAVLPAVGLGMGAGALIELALRHAR